MTAYAAAFIVVSGTSLNRYLYCQNDPVNFMDSSGESLKSIASKVTSAVKTATTKVVNTVKTVVNKVTTPKTTTPAKTANTAAKATANTTTNKGTSAAANPNSKSSVQQSYSTAQNSSSKGTSKSGGFISNLFGRKDRYCTDDKPTNKLKAWFQDTDWNRVGTEALKIVGGALVVGVGVAAIVATGGLAAGSLLVAGTLVAGTAAVAFGCSDIVEGTAGVVKALTGDTTPAFNPIRDTVFKNDPESYYIAEAVITMAAGNGAVTIAQHQAYLQSTVGNNAEVAAGADVGVPIENTAANNAGTTEVQTPHGTAYQSYNENALELRNYVENGGELYKAGELGRSKIGDSQFWSTESPLTPGYADKYGVDFGRIDFIIEGTLKEGADVITRAAPGLGGNAGGAIEAVVPPNSVDIKSFIMP